MNKRTIAAIAALLTLATARADTWHIVVDVATKHVASSTNAVAIRELVPVEILHLGGTTATNLAMQIIDREGNIMAAAGGFTAGTNNNALGNINLNTTPLTNFFGGMPATSARGFTLVVADTNLVRELCNDIITVQNNPYQPGMPDPTPVEQAYWSQFLSTNLLIEAATRAAQDAGLTGLVVAAIAQNVRTSNAIPTTAAQVGADAAGAAATASAGVYAVLSPLVATAQATGATAYAVAVLASNLAANSTAGGITNAASLLSSFTLSNVAGVVTLNNAPNYHHAYWTGSGNSGDVWQSAAGAGVGALVSPLSLHLIPDINGYGTNTLLINSTMWDNWYRGAQRYVVGPQYGLITSNWYVSAYARTNAGLADLVYQFTQDNTSFWEYPVLASWSNLNTRVITTSNQVSRLINTYAPANSDGLNIWIGGGGLLSTTSVSATHLGTHNVSVGTDALSQNAGGVANVAVGTRSMFSNSIGQFNTAVGCYTLSNNTIGSSQVAIGALALMRATVGADNTAIGKVSMWNSLNSYNDTAVGSWSLPDAIGGQQNSVFGFQCGLGLTNGNNNTLLGANITMGSDVSGYVVLADGNGKQRLVFNDSGNGTISNNLTVLGSITLGGVAQSSWPSGSEIPTNYINATTGATNNFGSMAAKGTTDIFTNAGVLVNGTASISNLTIMGSASIAADSQLGWQTVYSAQGMSWSTDWLQVEFHATTNAAGSGYIPTGKRSNYIDLRGMAVWGFGGVGPEANGSTVCITGKAWDYFTSAQQQTNIVFSFMLTNTVGTGSFVAQPFAVTYTNTPTALFSAVQITIQPNGTSNAARNKVLSLGHWEVRKRDQ